MSDDQDLQPGEDLDLRAALNEAVDGVEPTDHLVRIRQATRARSRRRRAWIVAGGSGLAVASVVTVALVAGTSSPQRAADPAAPPTTSPAATPSATPAPQPARTAYPTFYVGPGPNGPDAPAATLYRSYVESTSPLEALMETPTDPDYRTLWPAGSLVSYDVEETEITVVLASDAIVPATDELARQQLLYTLQSSEQSDLPVALTYESIDRGVATISKQPALDVLSHMSIDEPSEGATFNREDGSLVVTGRGNSFEASGACFLSGADGLDSGPYLAQMSGWMEPRLFPWELTVDLTDVPPGTYTLACITDDPTGGAEGRGTDTDTRTVIIE